MSGGIGDDTLFGGIGNDLLRGVSGADKIHGGACTDRIGECEIWTDKILLVHGGFADINEGNIATRLTINAAGTAAANGIAQLIFDNAGAGFSVLSFDAGGNGVGADIVIALLVPATPEAFALSTLDFGFI